MNADRPVQANARAASYRAERGGGLNAKSTDVFALYLHHLLLYSRRWALLVALRVPLHRKALMLLKFFNAKNVRYYACSQLSS
jgi:hypothetical protein